ncbi:hypothetical protein SK128_012385, partial [Halocaridina rubra]
NKMDELLFQTHKDIYWRPGYGRSIATARPTYRNFQSVVRTVHVSDALNICKQKRMQPRPIQANSILKQKFLNEIHPCKNMKVLWFGTERPFGMEEDHNWYGNIQFTMPVDVILQRWKYCYLVEILTAKTHTATRLLITNTDYSRMLPLYNPHSSGGPWSVNSNGHFVLDDCERYNNIGWNRHGHTLEFMIEVTLEGQKNILQMCEISFMNHQEARNENLPLRCHRYQYFSKECPTPFSSADSSREFFFQHQKMISYTDIATPNLSEKAEYYRQHYYMKTDNRYQSLTHPQVQSQISPQLGQLLAGLTPRVDQFQGKSFTRTEAEMFHLGRGRVYVNNKFHAQFMPDYTVYHQQLIMSWWSSLDDYCRSVMLQFWSQESGKGQQCIPGWPTPGQQHNKKRRKRRYQSNQGRNMQSIENRC